MQEKATPRVSHLGKACGSTVAYFGKPRQMSITAELEDEYHKHEERHEEMQAVKLCYAAEHERNYGDLTIGITELAGKKKAGEHVEYACGKSGRIHDGHDPLIIGHVI